MTTDPLRSRLEALPAPPLPDDLWPRLARRRQRHIAVRRAGIALGARAVALVLVEELAALAVRAGHVSLLPYRFGYVPFSLTN